MIPILDSLDDLRGRYDAVFCDLWGCLHDGVRVFPAAVAALVRFRAAGGTVLLLTNSPRPASGVAEQVTAFGAPRDSWDLIVSSGDAAQAALVAGLYGRRVHHVGPERDLSFFTDLSPDLSGTAPERVPLAEAEGIVCTGLFDDTRETPADYRPLILQGVARGLPFLCANPDVFVDRGHRRVWCAGGIAAAYAEAGGKVGYFGKPHAPIYALARQRLAALRDVEDERILCIGDGPGTDIAGGVGEGFDTLFVTGGLALPEIGGDPERPETARVEAYLAAAGLTATAAIGRLR